MATVNGLTAERMIQIENSSVTSGLVDAQGRLILKTRGNDIIDAGIVRGPQGDFGPTGTVSMFAGATAPVGYLICDGAAVSRTTYAALFAIIGTTYGVGNGTSTFNLPNLKGRVPVGRDTAQTEFNDMGETGGAKTHTLTESEMPVHTHAQNPHNHTQNSHGHTQSSHTHTQQSHNHTQSPHTHSQYSHNHSQNSHTHSQEAHGHNLSYGSGGTFNGDRVPIGNSTNAVGTDPHPIGATISVNNNTTASNQSETASNYSATAVNDSETATNNSVTASNNTTTATNNATTATNQNTGGGQAHNNLQPYLVMNYIIKT